MAQTKSLPNIKIDALLMHAIGRFKLADDAEIFGG